MKLISAFILCLSLVSCTVSLQNSHSEGHGVVQEDLKQDVEPKLTTPVKWWKLKELIVI